MSVLLSCPSCNTGFELDAVPRDRRANCPRCGDTFPIRGEVAEQPNGARSGELTAPPPTPYAKPNADPAGMSSLRRTALVAVALGVLGSAIGLTAYYSRGPKSNGEPQPEPPTTTATPPTQLVGLGYLPTECNVIFAVQPGPLLAFATRTHREPQELLTGAGIPAQAFTELDRLGLALAQIDHMACGIGDAELRITFVLVLKHPLSDEDEFLKKLNAKPDAGKKSRYTVDLAKLPLMLARVSPVVWVFGLTEKDFTAVDRGGFGPGGKQFRAASRKGYGKCSDRYHRMRLSGSRPTTTATGRRSRSWPRSFGVGCPRPRKGRRA